MSEEIKGWKLVPCEPTEEILLRISPLKPTSGVLDSIGREIAYKLYQAMLAAAPEPSARTQSKANKPVFWVDPADIPITRDADTIYVTTSNFDGNTLPVYLAAPAPSASVGMEPVAYLDAQNRVVAVGLESNHGGFVGTGRAIPASWTRLIPITELATLQAKLEQAEKDMEALLPAMQEVLRISDRKHDAWDRVKELIAEYEVKK